MGLAKGTSIVRVKIATVLREKGEKMPEKSEIKGRLMIKLTDGSYIEIPEEISLEEVKTIAEQHEFVRVVRCKDCRHYVRIQSFTGGSQMGCEFFKVYDMYDDDYCSRGCKK